MPQLGDGVLDEDIGHVSFRPDKDLVDELISVVNKHTGRLRVGNIFGSLLVLLRAEIMTMRPTRNQIHDMCILAAQYLSRPPRKDPGLRIEH